MIWFYFAARIWNAEFQDYFFFKSYKKCREQRNRLASGWVLNSSFCETLNPMYYYKEMVVVEGHSIWEKRPPKCHIDDLQILNEGNLQWY